MICRQCKEAYEEKFWEDFKDGVCLPCSSQAEYDKWLGNRKKQVARYNKKFGTNYKDDDEFYYACEREEIDINNLKGFPLLKEMWKWAEEWRKEYEALNNSREAPIQMSLFD